jgi:hypothetical protein
LASKNTSNRGPNSRRIPLTRGYVAIVDVRDYVRLSKFKWHAQTDYKSGITYAYRSVCGGRPVSMGKDVLRINVGPNVNVAFRYPSRPLDYRRDNLVVLSAAEMQLIKASKSRNSTGYKGVVKRGDRFIAQSYENRKWIGLGTRDTAEAAYRELYLPYIRKRVGKKLSRVAA